MTTGRITEARYGRFKDAPWFSTEQRVLIVGGAGGIGSWFSLFAARANFECYVYDADRVEDHNVGGQLYGVQNVGQAKVEGLNMVVKQLAGLGITQLDEWYTKDSMCHKWMISAFDNMEARQLMFEKWAAKAASYERSGEHPVFIDGRLSMEQMQIFCVTVDTIDEYRKHLFPSSDVEDEACTMKQTSHSAAMIASHMFAFLTNHLTNMVEPDSREVPFYWSYYIPLDLLNTEPPVYEQTSSEPGTEPATD